MQKLVWQNANGDEINLTGGNYGITEWEGFSNTSLNIQNQQVPFQDGAVFLDALIEPRELSVTLKMQDNGNLEERYRMRRELIHVLNPKLGEGYLIYTNNYTSKRIKCVPQVPLFPTHNSNDSGTPSASLSWTACEPYWEDLEETVVKMVGGESVVVNNQGDVPCNWECELLNNEALNPKILSIDDNKEVKLNGEFSEKIKINTKTGAKSINECYDVMKPTLNFRSIKKGVYHEGKVVFVGLFGVIVIYDIINNSWSGLELESHTNLYSICYSDTENLYCAVGDGGKIYTSGNLKDWTEQVSNLNTDLRDVIYNKQKSYFVATGLSKSLKSADGINWESFNISGVRLAYSEIDGVTIIADSYTNKIRRSTDLINWTEITVANYLPSYSNITRIIYSKSLNRFLLLAYADYDGYLFNSEDGSAWVRNELMEGALYGQDVFCGMVYSDLNSTLCMISGLGGKIFQCFNILDSIYDQFWTYEEINIAFPLYNTIIDIMYVSDYGIWIIYCTDGSIYKSSDMKHWENILLTLNWEQQIRAVKKFAYSKDVIVAIPRYRDVNILRSDDKGKTWSLIPVHSENKYMNSLIYVEEFGKFFITISDGHIISSTNGINWENNYVGENVNLTGIAYYKSQKKLVVALGEEANKIYLSEDGINWTSRNSTGLNGIQDLFYWKKKDILVACSNNFIACCQDNFNWHFSTGSGIGGTRITASDFCKCLLVSSGRGFCYTYNPFNTWLQKTVLPSGVTCEEIYADNYDNRIYIGARNGGIYEGIDLDNWKIINGANTLGITSIDDTIIFGGETGIYTMDSEIGKSIIDKLSVNSELFPLKNGSNNLIYIYDSGVSSVRLSYRQKYLGV